MVKMSMEEKVILRDEIFKLNSDDQKSYERIKEICELLDEGGTLEKIIELMEENHLRGDEYFENLCPLASYVYWYALGREREDVCLWALETAKTIDGLILVWKPEHQKKLAENLAVRDKQGAYSERPLYLREEACLTDAPNYIAAVLSGNLPLVKAFEDVLNTLTEEESEDGRVSAGNAQKDYYTISRKGVADKFCIPNLLTAAIMSGKPLMLEHYMVNYKEEYERAVMNPNHRKALGRAIAGTGELMSIYIKEEHRELLDYVTPMQIINAGNAELLSATGDCTGGYEEAFCTFSANLDLVTPYDSVPGFPRGYRLGRGVTDREMFKFFFDRADSGAVLLELRGILEQKDYDNTAKAEEKRHCCGAELFNQSGCGGADARSESANRKRELRKLYEELNSKWKEEVQKAGGETNDFWSNQDRECAAGGEKTADCDEEAEWSPDRIVDEIIFGDREN